MAIESVSSTTQTTQNDLAVNPKSILGKDDFLKLLLTELEHQDPTSPMDTEKILTQTSQLATLETQQNTNKTLEKIADQFQSSANLSAINAIGKLAKMGSKVKLEKDKEASFNINFEKEVKSGNIDIYNSNKELVKSIPIKEGASGNTLFKWDGTDNSSKPLPEGFYEVSGKYTDKDGNSHQIDFGTYPIEGVSFDNGKVMLKIGNQYVPMENISQILDNKG
jgi:flagellar basal-body rod modification protein FlgD